MKLMKTINVLITHVSYQASSGSFIKLFRSSDMFKYYIVGSDSIKKGYSSGSMLVDKFYHVPFDTLSLEYISYIDRICLKEKIDLVISAEEDDLIAFKKNKISQAYYQYIPDFFIFNLFKDKHNANIDIEKRGVLIPKTIMNLCEFEESTKNMFIYRKRVSCCSRGIKIFERNEKNNKYIFFSDGHITQEFINGEMYTVDVLCDKYGKLCLAIPRMELASKDGTTFKCIIEHNDLIINICKKIYNEYCIPGLSNIQFILCDSKPYFIELNPRAAATMIATALASVNYLDLYIAHIINDAPLPDFDFLMKTVKWNSVVSRYYQETILVDGEKV